MQDVQFTLSKNLSDKTKEKSFNMTQLSQPNNDPNQPIIELIETHIEEGKTLAQKCDSEATKYTRRKQSSRWINGILGVVTAVLGGIVTLLPPNEDDVRKSLGIASVITGAIVVGAGEYIDAGKHRKSAFELRIIRRKINNLTEQHEVIFSIRKDSVTPDELLALDKNFTDELSKLEAEAFSNGVDV